MLPKVRSLLDALNASNISYCHWKSNMALAEALDGATDLDLLVRQDDTCRFRELLRCLSFRPAMVSGVESFPSVEHHFALDEGSGVLVHVHAYYQVITGESLTKNYHFPIEEMLLENTREAHSVRVPVKSAELIVFTLRMMMKHTSLTELAMLSRYWQEAQEELGWLLEDNPVADSLAFVERWLPSVDTGLFSACIDALSGPAPVLQRVLLANRLRSQLRPYARGSALRARLKGLKKFMIMLSRRLRGSRLGVVPQSGGTVIAFVGPEATGKSTLLAEVERWFGEHFNVEQIHVGKPKSTLLSFAPNLLVPALRSLFPAYRSTRIAKQQRSEAGPEKSPNGYPLIFALRSALLGYDRQTLLTGAFERAAQGTIVLCDRYPSSERGVPDGPQLSYAATGKSGSSIHHLLARLEARLYGEIPPPDLVIYLCAPLEVTLSRNRHRDKTEPEDYVRERHKRSSNLTFDNTEVRRINTDQPFDLTLLEVKRAIWQSFN